MTYNRLPTYKVCEEVATLDTLPVYPNPRPDIPYDHQEPDETVAQKAKRLVSAALAKEAVAVGLTIIGTIVWLGLTTALGYLAVAQWLSIHNPIIPQCKRSNKEMPF